MLPWEEGADNWEHDVLYRQYDVLPGTIRLRNSFLEKHEYGGDFPNIFFIKKSGDNVPVQRAMVESFFLKRHERVVEYPVPFIQFCRTLKFYCGSRACAMSRHSNYLCGLPVLEKTNSTHDGEHEYFTVCTRCRERVLAWRGDYEHTPTVSELIKGWSTACMEGETVERI